MHRASCLCGGVVMTAGVLEGPYVLCHCQSCRKASGSAYGANIAVPQDQFEIVQGETLVRTFESSPGKVRHFCGHCGTPLFTRVVESSEYVRLRLGILDTELAEQPTAQIFTADRAPWHTLDESLKCYDAWPDAEAIRIPGSNQSR